MTPLPCLTVHTTERLMPVRNFKPLHIRATRQCMSRRCTICRHLKREEIDAALVAGAPYRSVAQRAAVSPDAVFRHSRHLSGTLTASRKAAEVARADSLVEQLQELRSDAQRLKEKAEDAGDYRTALAAIRELCRIVEVKAELTGELDKRPQTNVVNLHLDVDTARRMAETYLARHRPPVLEVKND